MKARQASERVIMSGGVLIVERINEAGFALDRWSLWSISNLSCDAAMKLGRAKFVAWTRPIGRALEIGHHKAVARLPELHP
jgi:hypothetical protein